MEYKKMNFGRTLIWINCWLFVGFGLGFVIAPETLAALLTGAAPITPSAIKDMRATYGGVAMGLAFIFSLCARNEAYVWLGVQGVLAVMFALASARALGMFIDGAPNVFMFVLLFAEAVMAILAFFALNQVQDK
jgi:uncharacterized protein YneF (UPF0154 family)